MREANGLIMVKTIQLRQRPLAELALALGLGLRLALGLGLRLRLRRPGVRARDRRAAV